MRVITREEIKTMLKDHKDWLNTRYSEDVVGKRLDFSGCDLSRFDDNLRSANLTSADLRSANLRSADLRSANLTSANLRSADLRSADLTSADLRSANLTSANLRSADLTSANLRSANLTSADLTSADLSKIKKDFFARLLIAKNEVVGLYDFIQKGKINGSTYEGDCCCFVGQVANIRDEDYRKLSIDLRSDPNCPTETWFYGMSEGDTPASNIVSRITAEWIEEFCKDSEIELPRYKIVSSIETPESFK